MPDPKPIRGGARAGAGRPRGAINRATAAAREQAAASGVTPLDFMLAVMRDDSATRAERQDMAKAAAPYIHSRLSTVEANVKADVETTVTGIRRSVIDPRHTDA